MKKIYECIPVASVLYVVGGLQRVMICDHKDVGLCDDPEVIYSGLVCNAYKELSYRDEHAQVRDIRAEGDTLIIKTCMKMDDL